MSRWFLHAASLAVVTVGFGLPQLQAQNSAPFELPSPEANPMLPPSPLPQQAMRIPQAANAQFTGRPAAATGVAQTSAVVPGAVVQQHGYVRLNAPMYPSPRPNIPIWTGGTMITNQALAPHEFLYPHTYRAMYPPFYHRVKGKYMWTPFGMRSHEKWELQGTMVQVKYRSSWPLIGPHKPMISEWGGPWK